MIRTNVPFLRDIRTSQVHESDNEIAREMSRAISQEMTPTAVSERFVDHPEPSIFVEGSDRETMAISPLESGMMLSERQSTLLGLAAALRGAVKSAIRKVKRHERRRSFVRSGAPSPELRSNGSTLFLESESHQNFRHRRYASASLKKGITKMFKNGIRH